MPGGPLLLFYDADCGWCRWSVARVIALDRRARVRPEPIQGQAGARLLSDLPPDARLASAHLVTPDGRRHSGGDAAAPLAAALPLVAPLAPLLRAAPGAARAAYRLIAERRARLGRLVSSGARERADAAIARQRARVPAA